MARCNSPTEDRDAILHSTVWDTRTSEELQQCRLLFPQYCFVETWGEKNYRYCRCSACEGRWERTRREDRDFFRLHHGDETVCPECGEKLTVQMTGRMGRGLQLSHTEAVSFVNTDAEGAVYIDSGIAFWDYYEGEPGTGNTDASFCAKRRYYIAPGRVQGWKRSIYNTGMACFYGARVTDWEATANITEPFSRNPLYGFDGSGYFIGLEKIKNSALRYCAIEKFYGDEFGLVDEWGNSVLHTNESLTYVTRYLAEAAMRPQIEIAVKLGMSEAVTCLLDGEKNGRDLNWRAASPPDFLRLTKTETREFLEAPTLQFLKWYHGAKKAGTVKTVSEGRELISTFGYSYADDVLAICAEHGISHRRAMNYIRDTNRAELWTDYVSMAKELGLDLNEESVLMPKELRDRHDQCARVLADRKNEIVTAAYAKRYDELRKKYELCMDGLRIVIPRSAGDIITEGKTLHHCVGGYADRHVEGKTTILFLRRERKPDTPYITIELDSKDEIKQIHGYKNEYYRYAVRPQTRYAQWLAAWQEWYRHGSRRDKSGRPIIYRKEQTA